MLAIAYDRGIGTDELAAWYDRPAADIEAAIDAVDAPTVTVEIARRERVDVAAVAAESNLAVGSVERWFAALGDRSVPEAASVIRGYAESGVEPLVPGAPSTVYHLAYDAMTERGGRCGRTPVAPAPVRTAP